MDDTLSGYLSGLYKDGGKRLGRSISTWRQGVQAEVDFWSHWFATKGGDWPEDYANRMEPQPLQQWLQDFLTAEAGCKIHFLDVGAGPITKAGTFIPDREVEITATDPLANFYTRIISDNGVGVPLATKLAFAEDLSCRFNPLSFDLINCQNALDHSIEPMWGIVEMFIVLKVGGGIFLGHRKNEAEFENYDGLHQWNFDKENEDFIIWNTERRINVSKILSPVALTQTNIDADFITVTIAKKSEFDLELLDYQRKLRAGLLEALFV